MNEIKKMADTEIIRIQAGNLSASTKTDRAVIGIGAVIGILLYAAPAYAEEDLFSTAATMMATYYGKIVALTTGLAILLILIAFIWGMVSPSPRGSEQAFSWAKKIALCWLVINCLGVIFKIGETLTTGQDAASQGYLSIQ